MPEPEVKDEKDYKALFEDAIKTRDAAKERARQLEEENNKFKQTEQDAKKKETERQQQTEQEKLTSQGKYQEALNNVESKYKTEIESLYSAVNSAFVPSTIKAAAATVKNITTEALNDLPDLLSKKIKLDPKTLKPFVVGDDGKQLCDEKLQPISVESFVSTYVSSRPYMLADGMAKGVGVRPGAGTTGSATFTVESALRDSKLNAEWKKADPEGHKRAFETYHSPEAIKARAMEKFAKK
jgi:hypothetical protein